MGRAGTVRTLLAVSSAAFLAGGGCGDRAPRLPAGEPLTIVLRAADLTPAAGRATAEIISPTEARSEVVDFAPPVRGVEAEALAALDLLRGAVVATAFGGQGVRGVSTLRVDVTVDFPRALERTPPERRAALERLRPEGGGTRVEIDTWVDVEGRARRVERSVRLGASPAVTTRDGHPAVVTTDFYGFRDGLR